MNSMSVSKKMICLFNFSGAPVSNYPLWLPDDNDNSKKRKDSPWECVFFSEDKQFGGDSEIPSQLVFNDRRAEFSLPALSAAFFIQNAEKKEIKI